jgi:hypothetical protein
MFSEGILNIIELFEATLGLLGLALHENDGAGEFIGHLVAATLEFLLTARQILQALLLLLDLFLPATKFDKLGLGPLHLILQLLR